ncbi:MAG: hypothetical protein K9J06_09680 [Flavobacteriales bacterium]|nr:hypothetical protein [Flavobacteriales bacterium]
MSDYLKKSDLEFVSQLNNFATKLPGYATALGLTVPETDAVQADSDLLGAVVMAVGSSRTYAQGWTSFKDLARHGGEVVLPDYPVAVNTVAMPPNVVPGIEERFRELVRRIKANAAYTVGMGEDLGIEADDSMPVITAPELKLKMEGGDIVISFKKGAAQGVKLYSKRGSETTFTFLAVDTRSPYVDNRPNLVEGVTEKREYYAFYLVDDAQVGDQSPTVSITV